MVSSWRTGLVVFDARAPMALPNGERTPCLLVDSGTEMTPTAGTGLEAGWRFWKINATNIRARDRLLLQLKSGSLWQGQLWPKEGSGWKAPDLLLACMAG